MNSSLPTTPADALCRLEALDPTRSFCVTAPAGSGKTELLSQRVLALLARVDAPEEILAVTFTRKAAAEMRQRIVAALQLAAAEPEPEAAHRRQTWQLARAALARDAERGWNLLGNPARLRLQTIDGLCSSLTAQMPVLSNFGGQPRIAEQAEPLYLEAVNALLEQLEQPGPLADSLARLLAHVDNQVERCQRLLTALLARRDQWLPHIGSGIGDDQAEQRAARAYLERGLERIVSDALARVHERLGGYEGELLALLDFAACRCLEADPDHELAPFAGCVALPEPEPEQHGPWLRLVNWLLTGKGEWRKRLTVKEGFPVGAGADKGPFQARKQAMQALLEAMAEDAALLEALVEIRHLPARAYSDEQWGILAHLTRLLPAAALQLLLVFQRRGAVDFTQIALSAQDALGDALSPSELGLRLDARIRHLLIDEFQDTSSSQFRLVKRLVEGWREHNESGASPQTLFIVGDGMQSIYGFREANVGLFLQARRNGVNTLELADAPLSVNFRSTPEVIGWINRVFAGAFPKVEHSARGAVPYAPSSAFKPAEAGSGVGVFGLRDADGERAAEAQHVVQLVRQALTRGDDSVAILVRYRSHLRAIVPALQRAGIAWRATDIDPLAQRAAILDLLALLKALLNPADRISWLALLRSPLIGLDHADLHALAAGADGAGLRQSVWSRMRAAEVRATLSADGASRVERALAVLDAALAQRGRKPLRSWLEGVWTALGGPLTLANDAEWRDLQRLLELVEQLADEFSLDTLEQRLQGLYARAETAPDTRVVVMTIHKSKGLEFDTVIVPGLDRGTVSDDKALLQWGEYLSGDDSQLVLAARPAPGADDAIYDYLDHERKQRQRLEDTRLLYVAVTRAKRNLQLLFCAKPDADAARAAAAGSLLARIWPAVADEVVWPSTAPLVAPASEAARELRIPADWRVELPVGPAPSQDANVPPPAGADTLETRVGIVIHALLQQLVECGDAPWRGRDTAQRLALARQLLTQQAVAPAELDLAARRVQQAVDTMLEDERGRWLLRADHAHSAVEWELLADNRRHVIDRSFVDADGVRWIVDYKSSMPREGESLESFIARETDAHRPQLLRYRELLARLEAREIKTALYFPRIPHWREIEG